MLISAIGEKSGLEGSCRIFKGVFFLLIFGLNFDLEALLVPRIDEF
jgi:hypothetical protein